MANYKFLNKSVWLEKEKILVIADLHLGYEESLRQQGVFLPKTQYKETIKDLNLIFEEIEKLEVGKIKTKGVGEGIASKQGEITNKKQETHNKATRDLTVNNREIKEIIILGDLKHEFGLISQQEWRETLDLIDYLQKKCEKIILVRGNHDNYLINVVKKEEIKLSDFYIKDDRAFIHGNKIFPEILDKKIKQIFIGHMHPAISIRKNVKSEIYKCFLQGTWRDKEIIILPSFFPLVEGADVSIEDTNLAFKPNLSSFEVFIPAENEVLKFGNVKEVGRLV